MYSSGGNVKIQAVKGDDGETASIGDLTFVTNTVGGDYKDDMPVAIKVSTAEADRL